MGIRVLAALLLGLVGLPVWATTIESIEIQGLRRIEGDAVRGKLTTHAGEELSEERIATDIRALHKMGVFKAIRVLRKPSEQSGKVHLKIEVEENPVIADILFEGNKQFSDSDLEEVIKLKPWFVFDGSKVAEDVERIIQHYEKKGYYQVKVRFEVQPSNNPQEVKLVFKIQDFEKLEIRKIHFLGAKRFTTKQLKDVFQHTKEKGPFSFVSSSGQFKDMGFQEDLQRLMLWYHDHGYIKFQHETPQVVMSEDRKWLFISIPVSEGEAFKIGSVRFSGDLSFELETLREAIKLRTGDVYSYTKRSQDIQALSELYQDEGHAFVNVIPKASVNDTSLEVDLEYEFEKGPKAFVREINIYGNFKTLDSVIRREMTLFEGQLFNGTRLRESRENIERLGFFEPGQVTVAPLGIPGHPDQVDLEVRVKERNTGNLMAGVNYGFLQGIGVQFNVGDTNLLGRGLHLNAVGNMTLWSSDEYIRKSNSFNISLSDYYFLGTRWSAGTDIFYQNLPIPNKWIVSKKGFDLRLGRPIFSDILRAYVTYKLEEIEDHYPSAVVSPEERKTDEGLISSVILKVARDQRNNRFETTAGNFQSAELEVAGVGFGKRFLKWGLNERFFYPIWGDLVFRQNFEVGQVITLSSDPVPPSQRFFLGGPNNMRGFEALQLGPRRSNFVNGRVLRTPLGGHYQIFNMLELEYPIVKAQGVKLVSFFDVGSTNNEGFLSLMQSLRGDVGFGVRWTSPFGTIRLEWGFPIQPRENEPSPVFQLMMGQPF